MHTVERVVIPEKHPKRRDACFGGRVNTQEGEFINREIDTLIKEKPTNNDLDNINKAIVDQMKQYNISPTENPFSYQWVANCVLYSVEEARHVNHQFRVDAGKVYANVREVIKEMSAQSTRQLTTKFGRKDV